MNEQRYKSLNAELSVEFGLFAIENPDWMEAHVPLGAVVVLQTDDPGFNAWALGVADHNRKHDVPPPPRVLVHIRELRPVQSRIVRAEAEQVSAR